MSTNTPRHTPYPHTRVGIQYSLNIARPTRASANKSNKNNPKPQASRGGVCS